MKLIQQPNGWSCCPAAFAMALNVSLDTIINIIGHNGSKIINDREEPFCREAFCDMECITAAIKLGFSVTMVPFYYKKHNKIIHQEGLVYELMRRHQGVIFCDIPHYVAWDRKRIFDPNGTIYDFPIKPEVFYLIKSFI